MNSASQVVVSGGENERGNYLLGYLRYCEYYYPSDRVILFYVRVSTEEQALKGVSLDDQRERAVEFAKGRGASLFIFADEGVSGMKVDRPAFKQLEEAVDKNKGNTKIKLTVAAISLSRLGRSALQMMNFTNKLEQQCVNLVVFDVQVDTSTAAGKVFFLMVLAFGQMEADLARERTVNALAHKRRVGEPVGRPQWSKQYDDGVLVDHPGEMAITEEIIKYAVENPYASIRSIAAHMNELGHKSKGGYKISATIVSKVLSDNGQYVKGSGYRSSRTGLTSFPPPGTKGFEEIFEFPCVNREGT